MADSSPPEPGPAAVEASTETASPPVSGARVFVYDTTTKQKLRSPVPASWLDGRFPHLKAQPSKKAGN